MPHFGITSCPSCGKLMPVIDDEGEMTKWEYLCPGTTDKSCGKAFGFVKSDDPDDVEE